MKTVSFFFQLLLLVAMLWVTSLMIDMMPDVVPTHYNASGVADAFGSKKTYWLSGITFGVIGLCSALTAFFLQFVKKIPNKAHIFLHATSFGLIILFFVLQVVLCRNAVYASESPNLDGLTGISIQLLLALTFIGCGALVYFSPRSLINFPKKTGDLEKDRKIISDVHLKHWQHTQGRFLILLGVILGVLVFFISMDIWMYLMMASIVPIVLAMWIGFTRACDRTQLDLENPSE